MRRPLAFAAVLLFAAAGHAGMAAGAPSAERGHAPARRAIAVPAAECLDGSHLLSHAAYLPTATENTQRCGHLLSTDTLLSVHHWDHT